MIQDVYINYEDATIKALKDYSDMMFVLKTCQDELAELEASMEKISGLSTSPDAIKGGSSKIEDSWVRGIDKKQKLLKKMEKANEYISWFAPAWDRLTDKERILLEERFMIPRENGGWLTSVKNRLYYEKTQAYDLSDAALKRLSFLLYGI